MKRYEVTIHQGRTIEYEEVFTILAENEEQAEFLALVKAEEDGFYNEGDISDIGDFEVIDIEEKIHTHEIQNTLEMLSKTKYNTLLNR